MRHLSYCYRWRIIKEFYDNRKKHEQKILERAFKSQKAEFIVVYGRRRVGKTFLIRQFFGSKDCIFFQVTGIQKGTTKIQLHKFTEAISKTFLKMKNWKM